MFCSLISFLGSAEYIQLLGCRVSYKYFIMGYLFGILVLICAANAFTETEDIMVMEKLDFEASPPYNPPSHFEVAKRARYMVHYIEWGVLATKSSQFNVSGVPVPFTNVVALVDGPSDNSTGIPYFYVATLDASVKDMSNCDVVCLALSEMETSYCKDKNYNPELPPCTRLTLCGHFMKVDDDEKNFALNAIFARFPSMKSWPTTHGFFPAKLDIKFIWLIDYYGTAHTVDPSDYFKANPLK